LVREKIRKALALSFLVLLPVALFWPALFSHKLLYGHDVEAGFLPFRAEIQRCLAAHQWPLWMPDLLGGMPGIGSCLLMFLYPTDLLASLAHWSMQSQLALDASVHVALAGVGMFLLLRRLERSLSAAFLGAVFFALSGSQISQIYGGFYDFVEGIALLPWVFWAVHKACDEDRWSGWALCGLFLALQILAGAAQLFVYTLGAALCFALCLAWIRRSKPLHAGGGSTGASLKRILLGLAMALTLAFLLAAPQIWLTVQYLPFTARQGFSYASFVGGSIRMADAVNWVVPGFLGWHEPTYHGAVRDSFTCDYFGLLPLSLAAAALCSRVRRAPLVPYLLGLALVALFFAQGQWTPFYGLFQHLPVLKGFRLWSRILFLATFAVCALSAFGFDALADPMERKAATRGAIGFACLALGVAAWAWTRCGSRAATDSLNMPWLTAALGPAGAPAALTQLARDSAERTLVLALMLAALLWLGPRRLGAASFLLLALAFHLCDQIPADLNSLHFMEPSDASPRIPFAGPPPPVPGSEPWRIFDPDRSRPNEAMLQGYDNLYGDHAMPMAAFIRIRDALLARPGSGRDLFKVFGVRTLFVHSKQSSASAGDQVSLRENPDALSRAWLVARARTVSTDEEAYTLLADPRFDPATEAAVADSPPLNGLPPSGQVLWTARTPQSCAMEVTTRRDAVLVLSDIWYPSWRCFVDGAGAPLLKADGGFMAVLLKPGTHQVAFRFDDSLFYAASLASLAGFVALLGLCL
jgi:hypothetical protein